jgi:iron complex transport system ATP-binding protein
MIRLEHIGVKRAGRWLVHDLHLKLKPGSLTVILGANGAGKSTIMRVLNGEWIPHEGEVRWSDTRLQDLPRRSLARMRAVVSQHYPNGFAFTALDLVMLGRLPHTGGREESHREIAALALKQVALADMADRSVLTMSGGERQRAHLARALAQLHEARAAGNGLLLLDEPTAHLDLARQHHFLHLARELAREGITVVAVLHDIQAAADIADQIALMRHGRLFASGDPHSVLSPELLTETYGCPVERTVDASGRWFFAPRLPELKQQERIHP